MSCFCVIKKKCGNEALAKLSLRAARGCGQVGAG